jgi:single-stranded DNA-binding protein
MFLIQPPEPFRGQFRRRAGILPKTQIPLFRDFTSVFSTPSKWNAGEYVTKGRPVLVEGRLQSRMWTDRDEIERTTFEVVRVFLPPITPFLGRERGAEAEPGMLGSTTTSGLPTIRELSSHGAPNRSPAGSAFFAK